VYIHKSVEKERLPQGKKFLMKEIQPYYQNGVFEPLY
jgi:hypothetical protein